MIVALRETIFPLFLLLGILLRVLGALGFGAVVGAVLKSAIEREETTKYLIPVVIFVAASVFIAMGISNGNEFASLDIGSPGSPGTVGAFGLGVTLTYFLVGSRDES